MKIVARKPRGLGVAGTLSTLSSRAAPRQVLVLAGAMKKQLATAPVRGDHFLTFGKKAGELSLMAPVSQVLVLVLAMLHMRGNAHQALLAREHRQAERCVSMAPLKNASRTMLRQPPAPIGRAPPCPLRPVCSRASPAEPEPRPPTNLVCKLLAAAGPVYSSGGPPTRPSARLVYKRAVGGTALVVTRLL